MSLWLRGCDINAAIGDFACLIEPILFYVSPWWLTIFFFYGGVYESWINYWSLSYAWYFAWPDLCMFCFSRAGEYCNDITYVAQEGWHEDYNFGATCVTLIIFAINWKKSLTVQHHGNRRIAFPTQFLSDCLCWYYFSIKY